MDLKTLHKRVVKLESLVRKLSKWTHFNPEVGNIPSDDEIGDGNEETEADQDQDDFAFEILPDRRKRFGSGVGVDDDEDPNESSASESGSGDDSDYTPRKSRQKKMKISSKVKGTSTSTSCHSFPGNFTWSLPTSSSVQRAIEITATTANNARSSSNSNSNPEADTETTTTGTSSHYQKQNPNDCSTSPSAAVVLKTEVDFSDEFNENDDDDRDFDDLYPQLTLSQAQPQPQSFRIDTDNVRQGQGQPLQLLESSRRKPMLEKDGYSFQLHTSTEGINKRIWRCTRVNVDNCFVRLHTTFNFENLEELGQAGEHTHPPNPLTNEVRRVVAVIRQEALNQRSTPAAEIIEQCLQQLPPELKDHLPRMDSLKRIIRNARGEISKNKKPRKKYPRFQAPPAPASASAPSSASVQAGSGSGSVHSSHSNSNSTSSNSNSASATGTSISTSAIPSQNVIMDNAKADGRLTAPPPPADNVAHQQHPLQLLESRKGKPMLDKDGYSFQLHTSTEGINKRIWRCNRVNVDNCLVRLHTTFNLENLEELGQVGEHTHPPDPMTIEARRVMAAIRQEALTTSQTPAQIVANYLPQLPPEVKELLRVENVKRQIRKIRESLNSSTGTGTSTNTNNSQRTENPSQNSSTSNLNRPSGEFNLLQPPPHPHPQEPSPSLLASSSSFGDHPRHPASALASQWTHL